MIKTILTIAILLLSSSNVHAFCVGELPKITAKMFEQQTDVLFFGTPIEKTVEGNFITVKIEILKAYKSVPPFKKYINVKTPTLCATSSETCSFQLGKEQIIGATKKDGALYKTLFKGCTRHIYTSADFDEIFRKKNLNLLSIMLFIALSIVSVLVYRKIKQSKDI